MLKMTDILTTLKQQLESEFPTAKIYTSEVQGRADGTALYIYLSPVNRQRGYELSHYSEGMSIQIAVETLFRTQDDDINLWDAVDKIVDMYGVPNSTLTVSTDEGDVKLRIQGTTVKYMQTPGVRRQEFLHYGIVTLLLEFHGYS